MASAKQISEPWSGNGWPHWIFVDQQTLLGKKTYFCSRDECGRANQRILREPWQLQCGHRLCKECYDHMLTLPKDQGACDACNRKPFDDDDGRHSKLKDNTPTSLTLGKMPSLSRQSDSPARLVSSGAEPTQDTVEHRSSAEDQVERKYPGVDEVMRDELNKLRVNCPYRCDTLANITLGILEKHMISCKERLVACEKCAEDIKFSAQSEHANNSCPFRIVECPNKCGKRGLQSQDLPSHLVECVSPLPKCYICGKPYALGDDLHAHLLKCVTKCPLNCGETSEVRIVDHLEDDRHCGTHLTVINELLSQLPNAVQEGQHASSVLQNLENLDDVEHLYNQLIYLLEKLQSCNAILKRKETIVESTQLQIESCLRKTETMSQITTAVLHDQKTALKNAHTSYNGHLIWPIHNVQRCREEPHINQSLYSQPFYTAVSGYKMCAKIYFNGNGTGENTHISLFFVVMKGEYDALLHWPFQQKVTMKLRNQKARPDIVEKFRPEPSSSSFQRPENLINVASGCPQFAEQTFIFAPESGFVVDDVMFIDIKVTDESLEGLNVPLQEVL